MEKTNTVNIQQIIAQFKDNEDLYETVHGNDIQTLMQANQNHRLTVNNKRVYYTHDLHSCTHGLIINIQPLSYMDAIMYLQNLTN